MKRNLSITFLLLSFALLFVSSAETKRRHNSLFAVADLSVTKVDTPDPVNTGSNLTYTITVTNNGPDAAANASWSDTLPAGTTLVRCLRWQGGRATARIRATPAWSPAPPPRSPWVAQSSR